MEQTIHANSVPASTTSDHGSKLVDIIYDLAKEYDCTIVVDDVFCHSSHEDEYRTQVDLTFDLENSDLGDVRWDDILRRLDEEIDRHPFFEDYEHNFF